MFWFALAAVAMSAAQAAQQKNASSAANSQAYTQSLKGVTAQNQAIEAANTANVIRTGYRVGLVNLQTARLKQQAIEQGFDTSVQGVQALGATQAQAAASGTVGNSVDAAVTDIQKKQDEAQIHQDEAFTQMLENQNLTIEQIVQQGQDALQSARDVNDTVPHYNPNDSFKAALVAGAGTALSIYSSQSMSLGKAASSKATIADGYSGTLTGPWSYGTTSNYNGLLAK